jgi:O-phospho-L-seryl-tRNASec:L-selenocysteinyl-tRNA synthase
MVPVGGSLVYSSNDDLVNRIKKNYPGRASMAPILDLFITLLEMGKNRYKQLIKDRKEKYIRLKSLMTDVANHFGERIIETPNNKISLAMSLTNICKDKTKKEITYLGSLFYSRQISGIKILAPSEATMFNGYKFNNYGTHCENYDILPYYAFAAGIGISDYEIEQFKLKFVSIVEGYLKKPNLQLKDETDENKNKENKAPQKRKAKLTFVIEKANEFSI